MIVKEGLTEAQSPDTIWIGTKKAIENPEYRDQYGLKFILKYLQGWT